MQTLTLDNSDAWERRPGMAPSATMKGQCLASRSLFRCLRPWRAGVPEGRYSRAQNTTACVLQDPLLRYAQNAVGFLPTAPELHFRHTITHAAVQTEAE